VHKHNQTCRRTVNTEHQIHTRTNIPPNANASKHTNESKPASVSTRANLLNRRMSYICPECTKQVPGNDTYASVLVFGVGQLASTLNDIRRIATINSVANISSYCINCMRITPSLNTDVSIQENVMEWKRKHAFYTSCEMFIQKWPKKNRINRLRKHQGKQK